MNRISFCQRLRRPLLGLLLLSLTLAVTAWGATVLLEWKPKPLVECNIHLARELSASATTAPNSLDLLSWNIGYAGLDAQADAFMDGGKQVGAASPERVRENLSAVKTYLHKQNPDVILLQEVDDRAKRTFNIDQVQDITASLPKYAWTRARNFLSPFVPVPVTRPLGRVQSGLLSLSRYAISHALRHQLPGDYNWPVRVFHLKRCLQELRFKAADGHDWVIINLHLSAFDKGGFLRRQQMQYLRGLILKIARQGHHVVVGGDWNQAFPGLTPSSFTYSDAQPGWFQLADADWTPKGWHWFYDAKHASLRATNKPYRRGENFLTTVDGWLLSPDLQAQAAHCENLDFANSDHNPVQIRVSLPASSRNANEIDKKNAHEQGQTADNKPAKNTAVTR